MLSFEKLEDVYRITETIHREDKTVVKIIDYKFDLSKNRVNQGTWEELSKVDRDWFNNYHLGKFPTE